MPSQHIVPKWPNFLEISKLALVRLLAQKTKKASKQGVEAIFDLPQACFGNWNGIWI
jgi:hypothetical protein